MAAAKSVTKLAKSSNGKISWPRISSAKQIFNLPDSIIYYITKNPSTSKLYSKLIQSCKHFFEKNPILVVARIYDNAINNEKNFCSTSVLGCIKRDFKCCVNADISKYWPKLSCKLWIINQIKLVSPDYFVLFSTKIYRCENAELSMMYVKIILNEFVLLASLFQNFDLYEVEIINNDGSLVMLENILESIPRVHTLKYWFDLVAPAATLSTMRNISMLKNLANLQELLLCFIPETLNLNELYNFIINHKDTKFSLHFVKNLSANYRNQLDHLVDDIVDSEASNCVIEYDEQVIEKKNIMISRCNV